MVDAESQHFMWTALHWAAVTLNQAERVRASFEPFRARVAAKYFREALQDMRVEYPLALDSDYGV